MANLVAETIANLRPKLEMPADFEASCTLVLGVEEEFLAVLKEKMPGFMAELLPGGAEQVSSRLSWLNLDKTCFFY